MAVVLLVFFVVVASAVLPLIESVTLTCVGSGPAAWTHTIRRGSDSYFADFGKSKESHSQSTLSLEVIAPPCGSMSLKVNAQPVDAAAGTHTDARRKAWLFGVIGEEEGSTRSARGGGGPTTTFRVDVPVAGSGLPVRVGRLGGWAKYGPVFEVQRRIDPGLGAVGSGGGALTCLRLTVWPALKVCSQNRWVMGALGDIPAVHFGDGAVARPGAAAPAGSDVLLNLEAVAKEQRHGAKDSRNWARLLNLAGHTLVSTADVQAWQRASTCSECGTCPECTGCDAAPGCRRTTSRRWLRPQRWRRIAWKGR